MEWPIRIGEETYFVGPEHNTCSEGLISDAELERRLKDAYEERFQASSLLNPKHWFQASLFTVFIALFVAWAMGAFCLAQFYLAVYQQGFNAMP
jgi:hypothetical protein